jgi:hypothetical protein
MDKNLKLLVMEGKVPAKDRRLGGKLDRVKTLNALAASGAKVRHDSGGRLIVIEASKEVEKSLAKSLPDVRLVRVDTDVRDSITSLDPTESLFLDALKIRASKSYRDAKKRRKFGETPEEQELLSAPDVREEY